ncbi:hypothetical protein [Blastococcus sp. SYSU DS1024]
MSGADGWPTYTVDVEHLPERSMRLWLREGASRSSLGTVERATGMYPVVHQRVADHLGLTDPEFYVELRIPRPPYVRDGDRVTVTEDDGRRTEGVVRGWIDGHALVEPVDPSLGGGLFAPEELLHHDG